MFLYLKSLHIIFVVTWFSGLFYIVRLFIYNTEANEKEEPERGILIRQFSIMIKRLWLGITWPSAILTLIFGPTVLYMMYGWHIDEWMWFKLFFVLCLYLYHFSLHRIYREQMKGVFSYTSIQLRIWNEAATVLLFAIVMLVVVKNSLSFVWGLTGLFLFVMVLMGSIKIYKRIREKKN